MKLNHIEHIYNRSRPNSYQNKLFYSNHGQPHAFSTRGNISRACQRPYSPISQDYQYVSKAKKIKQRTAFYPDQATTLNIGKHTVKKTNSKGINGNGDSLEAEYNSNCIPDYFGMNKSSSYQQILNAKNKTGMVPSQAIYSGSAALQSTVISLEEEIIKLKKQLKEANMVIQVQSYKINLLQNRESSSNDKINTYKQKLMASRQENRQYQINSTYYRNHAQQLASENEELKSIVAKISSQTPTNNFLPTSTNLQSRFPQQGSCVSQHFMEVYEKHKQYCSRQDKIDDQVQRLKKELQQQKLKYQELLRLVHQNKPEKNNIIHEEKLIDGKRKRVGANNGYPVFHS